VERTRGLVQLRGAALLCALALLAGCSVPPGGEGADGRGAAAVWAAPESESGGGSEARTADRSEGRLPDGLPGEAYTELAADGVWSWFTDPRAVSHAGALKATYFAWLDSLGNVIAGRYDHDGGSLQSSVVREKLQRDDRASPSLLVRDDGRVTVFYSGRRGRWLVYRMSKGAEDVTAWGKEHAASGHTSDYWGYSYPSPAVLASEGRRRYVFWTGEGHRPMFCASETGLSWSGALELVEGGGERPHIKIASDGARAIHIALTSGQPGVDDVCDVYYMRYEDGAFRRADGSLIAEADSLPVPLERMDRVYDSAAQGAPAWVWDVACDASGDPVIAFAVFPARDDHRYRYAVWSGGEWRGAEITDGGGSFPARKGGRLSFSPYYSGGVAIDSVDPSVVYVSRPVGGVFEIERWATTDAGVTWTAESVTSGSSGDNVRPVVPRNRVAGGPELAWVHVDAGGATSLRMK